MPLIRVYSNKFSDEAEHNSAAIGSSFRDYLRLNVSGYNTDLDESGLFSVSLNSCNLPPSDWDVLLVADDVIDVVIEPKGTVAIITTVIAVVTAVASMRMMNNLDIPDTYNSTTPDSSSIYSVNAQGNQPKLMAPAPVLFGTHKTYPDYICPSYRTYVAHEEWRYFMLSVCAHAAQINTADIRIGDTSVVDLGSDVDISVFQPSENVAGHPAHRNMYSVAEVDGAGVQINGVIPSFEWATPFIVDEYAYLWEVQSDTTKLNMNKYQVNEGGLSAAGTGDLPWRYWFDDAGYSDVSLVGVVLLLWTGVDYQYFRCIDDAETATFARVDPVTFEIDNAWTGFGTAGDLITGYYQTIPAAGDWGNVAGWFNCCPPGETTTKLEFDFHFPEGLAALDSKGIPREREVTILIEYRNGSGGTVISLEVVKSESTVNARAWTIPITVSDGAWQARVSITSTTHNKTLTKERMMWNGLRSELTTPSSYSFTTIAVAIKGTQRLSSASSNKINCIATGMHPELQSDLTWSAPVATRSVAAAVGAITHAAGNTDEQINLGELYRIGQILNSRGDYFDGLFDKETTSWEAIKRVLAIGWAEPVVDFGQILPVRDSLKTDLGWQFGEQNITGKIKETIAMPGGVNEKHDGVEVEYIDKTTYKSTTVLVTLDGDTGLMPEKIRIYGLASDTATRAIRHGLRHLRTKKYRNRSYQFSTEQDALECKLYDPAQLGWAMPHRSQTGEVKAVNGTLLRLSEPVEFTSGEAHTIIVSNPEGFATGPYTATETADPYEVTISPALTFTPEFNGRIEPPRYQFGTTARRSVPLLITKVTPQGQDACSVAGVVNDVRVYSDDDYGIF